MLGDVSAVGCVPGLGDPAVAEADEHAGEASRARREVVVGELAGAAGEVHDDRDDEFRLDGVEEARVGLDLVPVADGLEDHAGVAERKDAVGEDPVLGAFDGDDVGEPERPGLGRRVVRRVRLAEQPGRGRDEHEPAVALPLHGAVGRLAEVERPVEVDASIRCQSSVVSSSKGAV